MVVCETGEHATAVPPPNSQKTIHVMKLSTNPMAFRLLAGLSASVIAFSMSACEVKKTQEGEMPEVNVEGGQAPKYDVEAPDVKVEEEKKTITVPDVDIVTPEEKRAGGNVEAGDAGAPPTTTDVAPDPAPAPAPAE